MKHSGELIECILWGDLERSREVDENVTLNTVVASILSPLT